MIWTNGISKKTVMNVPAILPIVETEYKFPEVFPSLSSDLVASFTAYGEIIPSKRVGIMIRMNVAISELRLLA